MIKAILLAVAFLIGGFFIMKLDRIAGKNLEGETKGEANLAIHVIAVIGIALILSHCTEWL